MLFGVARKYNEVLYCEVNDIGDQVASILQYDLEYQNFYVLNERKSRTDCWTRILEQKLNLD